MKLSNNSIKVSVIIPVYNMGKYIGKCLDSIINQTLEDIEIICVNDGSKDNSLEIINQYANLDERIIIIDSINEGQGSARNKALSKARGEYVSFIDADDWIELNTYELLYSRVTEDNLDILFFQMVNYINSSINLSFTDLYDCKCFLDNDFQKKIFSLDDFKNFLFEIPVCPVSKLYKRNFLLDNNLEFPEGIIFEDNIFFYNAIFHTKNMGFLNKHLYYRRRHDESVTQNISNKVFDIVTVTNEILKIFQKNRFYNEYNVDIINHVFSMIIEWFFKSPIEYCEDFFHIIKAQSLGFSDLKQDFEICLNDKNKTIYNLFQKNSHYLDFISEYYLSLVNYTHIIESKKMDYKVSVIIPVYNNEFIIHRTLMSVLNQPSCHDCIEIILINDNSIGNVEYILDEYASKYDNVKAIHLNINTGSSGIPRDIGILEASADYLMFLDHDDFFDIGAVQKLYDEISDKDCDVVFGTYTIVSDNEITKISYPNEKKGYFNSILDNERLVSFPPPSIWTKMFKKDFILNNGFLFHPFLGEDAIFMSKVFLNAKGIFYCPNLVVCYHDLNKNSTTNNVFIDYLIEGLISEKYLYDLFKSIDKEIYFKYRCEGNIDFFLTQFLRSSITLDEFHRFYSLFSKFINQSVKYSLSANKQENKVLFDYFVQNNVDKIIEFKNNFGVPISGGISTQDLNKSKNILNIIKFKLENIIKKFT